MHIYVYTRVRGANGYSRVGRFATIHTPFTPPPPPLSRVSLIHIHQTLINHRRPTHRAPPSRPARLTAASSETPKIRTPA